MLTLEGTEDEPDSLGVHRPGDLDWLSAPVVPDSHFETYGGHVPIECDPSAKITAFGSVSYFIRFLKTTVAIQRLRKRYREFFGQEIADTVADPAELKPELRFLAVALMGRKQGSFRQRDCV